MTMPAVPAPAQQDQVALRVPADAAYLAVLRTATAGLAARLDLTLDEIEDLRIAVDEASALLMTGAADVDQLTAVFQLGSDVLDVHVSGPARELPDRASVAWAVLEVLVGDVQTGVQDHGSWIRLQHRRVEHRG